MTTQPTQQTQTTQPESAKRLGEAREGMNYWQYITKDLPEDVKQTIENAATAIKSNLRAGGFEIGRHLVTIKKALTPHVYNDKDSRSKDKREWANYLRGFLDRFVPGISEATAKRWIQAWEEAEATFPAKFLVAFAESGYASQIKPLPGKALGKYSEAAMDPAVEMPKADANITEAQAMQLVNRMVWREGNIRRGKKHTNKPDRQRLMQTMCNQLIRNCAAMIKRWRIEDGRTKDVYTKEDMRNLVRDVGGCLLSAMGLESLTLKSVGPLPAGYLEIGLDGEVKVIEEAEKKPPEAVVPPPQQKSAKHKAAGQE
jgi:hypothetical protein